MNHKRKKNTRLRGSNTHGWGMKKKHSGAGNRGGRGNAGTGKRADHKKVGILKKYGNKYFGKFGFVRKVRETPEKTINIYELNKYNEDTLNLTEKGYTKLLGAGHVTRKLNITVEHATAGAIEKIKKAGGEVTVTQEDEWESVEEEPSKTNE